MQQAPPPGRVDWLAAALGCFVAIVLAGFAGQAGKAPLTAHATNEVDADSDGDGAPDSVEQILGMSSMLPDTDFDGYGDAEELALQTCPTDPTSFRTNVPLSLGLTARAGDDGRLRLLIATYSDTPSGIYDSVVRFGVRVGGAVRLIDFGLVMAQANVVVQQGTSGGHLAIFDLPIDPNFVARAGSVTFFAAVGEPGHDYIVASYVDLVVSEGIVLIRRPARGTSTAGAIVGQSGPALSQGSGGLYQPIPLGSQSAPVTWGAGKICFQLSQEVGSSGSVATYEIVAADCVDGWDSFCEAECETSVGQTYQSVDAFALLGY